MDEFASELDGLCARAVAIEGRDPNATLTVGRAGASGLRVEATLRDGRRASRSVRTPGSLFSLVEALVALPPASASVLERREDGTAREPTPARTRQASAPAAAAMTEPMPVASSSPRVAERGGPELALQGTLRFAGPPATAAPSLVVTASWVGDEGWTEGWMIGARGRIDGVVLDLERGAAPSAAAFGGGLEGARRFGVEGQLAIDAGLGVDVVALVPLDDDDVRPGERAPRHGADGDVQGRLFGRLWIPGESASFCATAALTTSPAAWDVRRSGGDFGPIGAELGAGVAWGVP